MYKEVVRQKFKCKRFSDRNTEHLAELEKIVKTALKGEKAPSLPDVPYRWYDAFEGWNYLSRFGRPSSMGLAPLSFETVMGYVSRTGLEPRHELIRAEQIITIDIEFVKSTQKKD